MQAIDFFRGRIDAMINLNDPLAVLATRLPWKQIESAVAAKFEHQNRSGQVLKSQDMFGTTETLVGAGRSNAGRPKLPIRLMASLLYSKHSFNLSDEELVVRWSENIVWQFFSGMDYFEHRLPCDATQIGHFRRDLGGDGLVLLLKAKRRTAVEAAIGHLKSDHLMDRCWLQGALGDALHSISCAAGYNLRWLLRAIVRLGIGALFLRLLQAALSPQRAIGASYDASGRVWSPSMSNWLGNVAVKKPIFGQTAWAA